MAHLTHGMAIAGWLLIGSHAGFVVDRSALELLRDAVQELPRHDPNSTPEGRERRAEPRMLPSVRESKRIRSEPVTLDASAGFLR